MYVCEVVRFLIYPIGNIKQKKIYKRIGIPGFERLTAETRSVNISRCLCVTRSKSGISILL